MRKTKIICTMGPATEDDTILRNLMLAGMNVARINFSHGTHESAKLMIDRIKRIREELSLPVAILLDTKGPEIRLKTFKDGKAELKAGERFTLRTDDCEGDSTQASITYKNLPQDIGVGTTLLIDDGLIELEAISVNSERIVCEIKNSGTVSDKKGINVPNVSLSMPYMCEKDISDILFGIEQEIDFVAASFVRSADDVIEVRNLLEKNDGGEIQIIAKIENSEGVENIDEIIRVSNGIMVARGDMGVEIPMQELPMIQKQLIKKTYRAGKVVITATQMLDSMIRNPRPTRAETTDVANAIYDGTSAIMLSGETSIGKYPVEALKTMAMIAERTEDDIDYVKRLANFEFDRNMDVTNAISHATCTTAHDLKAMAIVAVTSDGATARMISRFRPICPIIAPTIKERTRRQLSLSWGVVPVMSKMAHNTDELFDSAIECAENTKLIKTGDLIVITGGAPLGISGTTNIMRVHLVGNVLVSGTGVTPLTTTARVCVAVGDEIFENFKNGDILVTDSVSADMISVLKRASGIICEESGIANNAAVLGMALDIPVITGAKCATRILKSGTTVTLDSKSGKVFGGVV